MVVPLTGLGLTDGDYEIELAVNGSAIALSTLRLRSGDTPDAVNWATCTRLNYEIDRSQLGPLSAVEASEDSSIVVDGLNTIGARAGTLTAVPARDGAGWSVRRSSSSSAPVVVLGVADPKSCVVTGAHYSGNYRLSTVARLGDRSEGSARPAASRIAPDVLGGRSPEPRPRTPHHPLLTIASHTELGAGWDECMDALVHVGEEASAPSRGWRPKPRGRACSLTGSSAPSKPGADRRPPRLCAAAKDWEANPAYLAETLHAGFVLAGVWSSGSRGALARL